MQCLFLVIDECKARYYVLILVANQIRALLFQMIFDLRQCDVIVR